MLGQAELFALVEVAGTRQREHKQRCRASAGEAECGIGLRRLGADAIRGGCPAVVATKATGMANHVVV